ncbi:MAG: VWA-like domain-containing protein [candidate division WOR-3 bacterium]
MEEKNLNEKEMYAYLIKTRSILIKEYPYFGYWALQGNIIIKDKLPFNCPAITDGKHYYFSKSQYKDYRDYYLVIFIHEVLHNQLDHIRRGRNKIWSIWMLAIDYAINSIIKDKLSLRLPPSTLYNEKFAGQSAEKIYDEIIRMLPPDLVDKLVLEKAIIDLLKKLGESRNEESPPNVGKESVIDDHKGSSPGHSDTIDFIWSQLADEIQKIYEHLKIPNSSKICGRLPDPRSLNPTEIKKMEQMVKTMIIRAAIFAKSISRGNKPGEMERYVDGLLKPKLDLREVLDMFAYRIGKGMDDYSFYKKNKREAELILPGTVGINRHIVIAIDTSGSINDDQLKRFLSEASTLSGTKTKITMVCVDTSVYGPIEIAEYEDIYDKVVEHKVLRGGGGTDFRGFFDFLNTLSQPIDGVIFFTDGCACYPDKSKEPDYPVLWIITERGENNTPPFGEILYLDSPE